MALKLFRHARIYTPLMGGRPAVGDEQGKLAVYEDGCFLVENGRLLAVGAMKDIKERLEGRTADQEFDFEGAAVVPGFVVRPSWVAAMAPWATAVLGSSTSVTDAIFSSRVRRQGMRAEPPVR